MNFIKKRLLGLLKFWQALFMRSSFLRSKTGKIILGLGGAVFIWLVYIIISMLSLSDSEIALAQLKNSYEKEKICHEECNLWRQSKEALIVSDLKNKKLKIENKIIYYFQTDELDLDFKKELVRINYLAYGKNSAPQYLKDYVNKENFNSELAILIISTFDLDFTDLNNLNFTLSNKYSLATSSPEKIEILKMMAEITNDLEINTYFSLINSNEEIEIKRELVKNISAIRDKNSYFTLNQLEIIKNIIISTNDLALRHDLILLIGDYYLVYPEESALAWFEIYNNKNLDSISRLFSADNLNHLKKLNLSLPEVSDLDWGNYYNQ